MATNQVEQATEQQFKGKNVPVAEVARIMGKDHMFVRIGIRTGKLPIGVAFKKDDSNEQFDYYISPKLLYEYTGFLYDG